MLETAKELDQFYTNPKVAERFVKKVDELYDLSSFDKVIEPSMGEGFIYNFLPPQNRIGLDIQKNHPDCIEGDFLKWRPDKCGIEYEPLMGTVPTSPLLEILHSVVLVVLHSSSSITAPSGVMSSASSSQELG